MIVGEPRLDKPADTDDHGPECERILVDANGEELVCRRRGRGTHGLFHRIDPDRYQCDGTIRPACQCTGCDDDNWRSQRRRDLNGSWDGCDYRQCYGTPRSQDAPHRFDGRKLRAEIAAGRGETEEKASPVAHQALRADRGGSQ